jgi:hypothetical protein
VLTLFFFFIIIITPVGLLSSKLCAKYRAKFDAKFRGDHEIWRSGNAVNAQLGNTVQTLLKLIKNRKIHHMRLKTSLKISKKNQSKWWNAF